jgi:hypothetical protein
MRKLLPMMTAVLLVAACGGDDEPSNPAGTGAAGAVAGMAGTGGVAGTAVSGMGGMAGTAASGMGGMAAGTAAGMGAGTAATGGPCDPYAASGAPRGTKDAVATLLRGPVGDSTMVGGCAFSSCHNSSGMASLDLDVPDIATALVNVPACQAEGFSRVTPGNPNMSWLWIKLVGPFDADGNVQNAATPKACPDTPMGTLGGAMPWTGGASIPLPDEQLFQICTWIEDGAM